MSSYYDAMTAKHYKIQFALHCIVAECLSTNSSLSTAILKAYSVQKVSERNKQLYQCTSIANLSIKTHRDLCQMKIVSYDAEMKCVSSLNNNLLENDDPYENGKEEIEYRRYIISSNSRLQSKLGVHLNDLSNLNFYSREIEITYDYYRFLIDPRSNSYRIQFKKPVSVKRVFLKETLTQENEYTSLEGSVYYNPVAIQLKNGDVLGIATFLDSKKVSVKTTYLMYEANVTLYQRIGVDDYSKSYPFILELEKCPWDTAESFKKAIDIFYSMSWKFDARLGNDEASLSLSTLPAKYTPINNNAISYDKINQLRKQKADSTFAILPKLDGYPATLVFYESHFIIKNIMKSTSYSHQIPQRIYHILRDYIFLVESELYDTPGDLKPNAMAIIDIQSGDTFTAIERYQILQKLKNKLKMVLVEYNIFFNGQDLLEPLSDKLIQQQQRASESPPTLIHDKIYEVLLDNSKREVVKVIRRRDDKIRANNCKLFV